MIVREIKTNPEILNDFDWFNDYTDTRAWAVHGAPELIQQLDAGQTAWLKQQQEKFKDSLGGKK